MTEISILDLQNLRHLIGGYSTTHCKNDRLRRTGNRPAGKAVISGSCRFRTQKQTGSDEIFIRGI